MKRSRASDRPRAQLKLFTELRRLYPRDYSWADLRYFRQKLERTLRQERGFKR